MAFRVNPLSVLNLPGLDAVVRIARRVRSQFRAKPDDTGFDLYNRKLVDRWLASAESPPLSLDPRSAEADLLGASRFVLARLIEARSRFPQGLSAGSDGAFAKSLMSDTGLSLEGQKNVKAAFEYSHRTRGERFYEIRDDLRARFPLALTPAQRGHFLAWFAECGRNEEVGVDPISVLWCLFEHDEEPGRGLVQSFAMQPPWQERFPHALTRFGWEPFKKWIAAEFAIDGAWLRDATYTERYGPWDELSLLLLANPELARTFPVDASEVMNWLRAQQLPGIDAAWERALAAEIRAGLPKQIGVNAIGFFRYPSGLQQAANIVLNGLGAVGVRTELRDVPIRNPRDRRTRAGFDGLERFPITILNAGLDTSCADAYRDAGLHRRAGVHRIAVWWWELSCLPPEWLDRGRDIDEIWAPTRHIAHALDALGKPIHLMPPSVELPAFEPRPKDAFGLNPGKFTFLFTFDMNSRLPRKNPIGLIRAFRLAFDPREPVELAIKVSPQEDYWVEQWRELRSAAAEAGVTLLDRNLSRGELLALMNAADAYISMHRAEGFGLTMAEAMLLGKPTAATAYSGNVDFMTAENSYPIDYSLVPIVEPEMAAPGGAVWAEPSVEHAASVMRAIVNRPEEAKQRGERARDDLRTQLSHRAAGERMLARLHAILGGTR